MARKKSSGRLLAMARSHKKLLWAAGLGLVATAALWTIPNPLQGSTRALIAWDVFTASFAALLLLYALALTPEKMAAHAAEQDEGHGLVLAVSLASAAFSVVAIWQELGLAQHLHGPTQQALVALSFVTVALSWIFTHFIFATHYAHEHYAPGEDGKPGAGLCFPGEVSEKPDFWDFLHFALIIAVANQTADVQIRGRKLRRIATLHSIVSFLFNTVILALSINFASTLFH